MAVLGGLGAVSSVGDRFGWLGAELKKNLDPRKIQKTAEKFGFVGQGPNRGKNLSPKKKFNFLFLVAVPMSLFSSKTDRFWPMVAPIGAARTEKT